MKIREVDLIREIAARSGFTQKNIGVMMDTTFSLISEHLKYGDSVRVTDFGIFTTRDRVESTRPDPRGGEPLHVPASRMVKFKVSKPLREFVNGISSDDEDDEDEE